MGNLNYIPGEILCPHPLVFLSNELNEFVDYCLVRCFSKIVHPLQDPRKSRLG